MDSIEVVDGGDRACGELLLVLAARARLLAPGATIRLIATDPAAAIDLPAWCHLTGNDFLAASTAPDGRACYELQLGHRARPTMIDEPWRVQAVDSDQPNPKETQS